MKNISLLKIVTTKITSKLLILIILLGTVSCEKEDTNHRYDSCLNYLSDKSIISIRIFNDNIWILSSKLCDTCYIPPEMSYIPTIRQLTVINDKGFEYDEPASVEIPCADSKGNLYTASGKFFTNSCNKIYKLNNIKDYELIFETGDFYFNSFTFDINDNIWFSGYYGIAFWDGIELTVYNTNNSELPSDITHGNAIDRAGNVWVALDFMGLLQITGDEWDIIPNSTIPGLTDYSYLISPIVDNEDNIWFRVFSSDTNSNILVYSNNEWIYQYPNQGGHGIINIDSQGTIWIINSEYEDLSFKKSTLVYLVNDKWCNFDVSMIDKKILTVNANDKNVFIGTVEGLVIIDR